MNDDDFDREGRAFLALLRDDADLLPLAPEPLVARARARQGSRRRREIAVAAACGLVLAAVAGVVGMRTSAAPAPLPAPAATPTTRVPLDPQRPLRVLDEQEAAQRAARCVGGRIEGKARIAVELRDRPELWLVQEVDPGTGRSRTCASQLGSERAPAWFGHQPKVPTGWVPGPVDYDSTFSGSDALSWRTGAYAQGVDRVVLSDGRRQWHAAGRHGMWVAALPPFGFFDWPRLRVRALDASGEQLGVLGGRDGGLGADCWTGPRGQRWTGRLAQGGTCEPASRAGAAPLASDQPPLVLPPAPPLRAEQLAVDCKERVALRPSLAGGDYGTDRLPRVRDLGAGWRRLVLPGPTPEGTSRVRLERSSGAWRSVTATLYVAGRRTWSDLGSALRQQELCRPGVEVVATGRALVLRRVDSGDLVLIAGSGTYSSTLVLDAGSPDAPLPSEEELSALGSRMSDLLWRLPQPEEPPVRLP